MNPPHFLSLRVTTDKKKKNRIFILPDKKPKEGNEGRTVTFLNIFLEPKLRRLVLPDSRYNYGQQFLLFKT